MRNKLLIFALTSNLIMITTAYGVPTYSGTCQDVGYNDKGENTQVNCSGGNLSAPGCTFTNQNAGALQIICGDSKYRYSCGNGSYNGNWYKINNDSYKCVI